MSQEKDKNKEEENFVSPDYDVLEQKGEEAGKEEAHRLPVKD